MSGSSGARLVESLEPLDTLRGAGLTVRNVMCDRLSVVADALSGHLTVRNEVCLSTSEHVRKLMLAVSREDLPVAFAFLVRCALAKALLPAARFPALHFPRGPASCLRVLPPCAFVFRVPLLHFSRELASGLQVSPPLVFVVRVLRGILRSERSVPGRFSPLAPAWS